MEFDIKILGPGCKKCKTLEENVRNAVEELGINANIEKICDIDKIVDYEILLMPGLVINEKVISSGFVLGVEKIKEILAEIKWTKPNGACSCNK